MELQQYYVAEKTIIAVEKKPATGEIIRIVSVAPTHLDLDAGRIHVVGAFLHFDATSRTLHTESGTQLRLQPQYMEKSRLLKEKTKLWLATLTK
jgi:hypothetical protein